MINRSGVAGELRIKAFDGSGRSYEALTLVLGAGEAAQFDSDDLELGDPDQGLAGITGAGEGDWRLELTSGLDIEVRSYFIAPGGRLSPMYHTAVRKPDGFGRHYVPIFHSAGQAGQESRLHLFNAGESAARVSISGLDDSGSAAPGDDVGLSLGPGETRVLTAGDLEAGGESLNGRLGTGNGGWRLFMMSEGALQVMSLGYGADGDLSNLSRGDPPMSGLLVIDARVGVPDLAVESASVDDEAPAPGKTFVLSATVRNCGDAAGPTTLRYYRSSDATITTSDAQAGTDAVHALAASGTSGESIGLSAPTTAGTYYYGACADAGAGESDTANNCSAGIAVTVSADPGAPDVPDLVVSASVDDGAPAPGGTFNLSATVRNAGGAEAGATTLRYYRSSDGTITTSDTVEGTDAVDVLTPSGTGSESITLTAPSESGTYHYGACVESVEGESDTANNCSSPVAVIVVASINGQPDLLVYAVGVDKSRLVPGEAYRFRAVVSNGGDGASPSTTLTYFRSQNPRITVLDTLVSTDAVGALARSSQTVHYIEDAAPARPGTYYYDACVDKVPRESNLSNNCSSSVAVTIMPPDLAVDQGMVSDSRPVAGASFTVSATVTNQGAGFAPASTLRLGRVTDPDRTWLYSSVGTVAVDALPASGTYRGSVTVVAPTYARRYYYLACVDAIEGESDETNNCSAAVPVTVVPPIPPPDLVVSDVLLSYTSAGQGTMHICAYVLNQGSESPVTTLRYYVRHEDEDSFAVQGTAEVPSLVTSDRVEVIADPEAPKTPGNYYVRACVDAVEDEVNTNNNCHVEEFLRVH